MYPIHDFGGQAQRQQCLPQMSLGTLIDCLGLTEPHDGSRPANMKTHTKRRGGDYLSNGAKVFEDQAMGPLCAQRLIETFAESAEPLCRADPEADPADEIVTLEEFLERWAEGGGDDLGNCASFSELSDLVEDRDPKGNLTFQIRVAGNIAIKAVTVPAD